MAAGTVTITEELLGTVKKVKFEWTSGDGAEGGTAAGTTDNAYSGEVLRLVTVPGVAPNAPTDDYDVVVNDEDTTDVLMGAGANRDTANTEQVLGSSLGCVANDKLSLAITNAGDAKKGTVYLYIR
jgi:hypothetical protein